MKRELLLEKIEEYKSLMPWFVLEYYQSKLSVPYSFTTLYEYLKEYKRFFNWLIDSGISDADDIASIHIKTLENLTKKDMESFVLYLRERPSLNTYSKKQGVSQTTINRTLSALSSLYKYLTEEVEGPDGEPYFYRNVMKKVSTKKKKETLAARAENIKQKLFLGDETMEFLDYVEQVCNEFRTLYANVKGTTPYCVKKVAVLNCWGKMRAWGCHMVHHALYQKQNYSYAGIIESLSGAPFDVKFISFQDILDDSSILDDIDVLINVGDADTAHTGGDWWVNPHIVEAVRKFVYNGGGIIGVGEPTGHQFQGRFFQLADVFGVEEEHGFTLGYDKYNWDEHEHFILEETESVDFGEGKKNIYALAGSTILVQKDKEVQMAVNEYGKGRAVYISGLPYSFENNRVLHRAIMWSTHSEDELKKWFSTNYNVDVHAYPKNNNYCVVNNTDDPQSTTIYRGDESSFDLEMEPNGIIWYEIQ